MVVNVFATLLFKRLSIGDRMRLFKFYTNEFVKRSLSAHSWLGLCVGVFMYWICLSGSIIVFYEELEAWEQPNVEEYRDFDINVIDKAYQSFAAEHASDSDHIHIVFPVPGKSRVIIEDDDQAWFLNKDGSLGAQETPVWTKMLINLHYYLHLPSSFGMLIVSALGVLLLALIMSGFFAHPQIIKDAFKLRFGGNKQLELADMHNRLSVWGAPFHIMIAITGAYFGLATMVIYASAQFNYEGDTAAVVETVFGSEPSLSSERKFIDIAKAYNHYRELDPESEAVFMSVHEAGTEKQFLEIYAKQPGRLVYSENYRYNAEGEFIGHAGSSDGPLAKQIVLSIYRLHFGHYGPYAVRLLYFVLGMALTVISVSGINLWLIKRKKEDAVDDAWAGIVWGTPIALVVSAAAQIFFALSPQSVFWAVVAMAIFSSLLTANVKRARLILRSSFILGVILFLLCYLWQFGGYAMQSSALTVNTLFFSAAVAVAVMVLWLELKRK